MGKNGNTRERPLLILRLLMENSDESHPVSMDEILQMLEKEGIPANRKSVYQDIDSLTSCGYDVVTLKGARFGYYLSSRSFEPAELKLLVDSVQSSRFITTKKTSELIRKIESLASRHEGADLQRQVYVTGRVKSMNESVYNNVDRISTAINSNSSVTFKYFDYDTSLKKVYHQDGVYYSVSPFALIWDNENYYLLGYDEPAEMMKHFRVDKMEHISVTGRKRTGTEHFRAEDLSGYSVMHFGMYHGELQNVRIRFRDRLAGQVIDRFGKDISMFPDTDGFFNIDVKVAVSPVFFSWIFSFGDDAEILGPTGVREEAARYLRKISSIYEN
ncbi:MAG: WYL domain-containing transcriptional regulator [Oscillospiraceae bacterium]|nr:WYL domain-containing transcriptional regulator [Oscillospiraceae bacterium]MBR5070941.1 WYL domain-containing transcriptional regulator [Oscillospiraceae bacterium]